jgi:hypothetical protein
MIDWGCLLGPCLLPLRKVQQLHLQKAGRQKPAKSRGVCEFYSPVRIELTNDKGEKISAAMEPFTSPESVHVDTRFPSAAVSGTAPPGAAIIPISPVKIPLPADRTDLDHTPLLGPMGLGLLGLGFDSKKQCLYAIEGELA